MDRTAAIYSYFEGRRADWKTALPTHGGLVSRNLWPGIDLDEKLAEHPQAKRGEQQPEPGRSSVGIGNQPRTMRQAVEE